MEETVVVIDGTEYKIGKPTAAQVSGIVRAFARLQLKARGEIRGLKDATDFDYIMAFLAHLEEDMLIELAALSIGVDKKFAKENFDLIWVTQALSALIKNANLGDVISNFTSMLSPSQD
jgi:hypothetical protein